MAGWLILSEYRVLENEGKLHTLPPFNLQEAFTHDDLHVKLFCLQARLRLVRLLVGVTPPWKDFLASPDVPKVSLIELDISYCWFFCGNGNLSALVQDKTWKDEAALRDRLLMNWRRGYCAHCTGKEHYR